MHPVQRRLHFLIRNIAAQDQVDVTLHGGDRRPKLVGEFQHQSTFDLVQLLQVLFGLRELFRPRLDDLQPAPLQPLVDGHQELVGCKGFGQKVVGAAPYRFDRHFNAAITGDDDTDGIGVALNDRS